MSDRRSHRYAFTVQSTALGRSGLQVPRVWLRLLAHPDGREGWAEELAAAASQTAGPLDISAHPARWGSLLPETGNLLLTRGGRDLSRTRDTGQAAELIHAHLFETLCSLSREKLDLYLVSIAHPLEEFQIAGALEALKRAQQEAHVGTIGLECVEAAPTLATWRFHDAFDVLLVPRNHSDSTRFDVLSPLAIERNVGLVTHQPFDWGWGMPFFALDPDPADGIAQAVLADLAAASPVLVGVRSAAEVDQAVTAVDHPLPGLPALLKRYRASFDEELNWGAALDSPNRILREAASRRKAALGASR